MEHSIIDFILNNLDAYKAIKFDKEYDKISDKRAKIYNEIREILTAEQIQLFDKYVDLEIDEIALGNEAYFKLGMKVGVRLVSECMFDL